MEDKRYGTPDVSDFEPLGFMDEGGVTLGNHRNGGSIDMVVIDETREWLSADTAVDDLTKTYVDTATRAVAEEDIEVKYIPNRAERRARQKQLKRSVRRGQRAYDRNIKAMEAEMTPEQIARARQLAAKAMGQKRG
jgi:RecA-family ATPase